jgi:hypothetical protein
MLEIGSDRGWLRPSKRNPTSPMVDFERRKRRRFIMSLPVSVRLRNDPRTEIRGVTRDVSSGGAFVFLQPNESAECNSAELIVELPAEVTLSEALKVACCARASHRAECRRPDRHGSSDHRLRFPGEYGSWSRPRGTAATSLWASADGLVSRVAGVATKTRRSSKRYLTLVDFRPALLFLAAGFELLTGLC